MALKPGSENMDSMSEINVTPLVDVMLVLVIILLVTAPLVTQSIHVTLPKTVEGAAAEQKQPLQLGIDASGQITLNKLAVANLDALENTLKSHLAQNPEIGLHFYADQSVTYAKVAEAMAVVQKAGITRFAFVTTKQ
jgi:biopolymer transport protein ExbD